MNLGALVARLSPGEYLFYQLLLGALALAALYFALRYLVRARIIEDTPTARVRSAHQGYVELNGQSRYLGEEPIQAPLTGIDCCWYRYQIEKRGDKNWRVVESETSDSLFLLRDETGDCIVDPEGAEITPSDRSVWYGSERTPRDRNPVRSDIVPQSLLQMARWLNQDVSGGFSRYRYTEERIYALDELYVLGQFKSLDDMDHQESRRELTGAILRDWKRDQPGLLQRYDDNKDGQIDAREWQWARRDAAREAAQQYRQQMQGQLQHSMGPTGSRRHPFLISTLPQFELSRRYRLYAGGSLLALLLLAAALAWLTLNHPA